MCFKLYLSSLVLSFFTIAHAHEGESHSDKVDDSLTDVENTFVYEEISKDYEIDIKPIFKIKCLDCHSNSTQYPWYYSLPIIKNIIDDDIQESKKYSGPRKLDRLLS